MNQENESAPDLYLSNLKPLKFKRVLNLQFKRKLNLQIKRMLNLQFIRMLNPHLWRVLNAHHHRMFKEWEHHQESAWKKKNQVEEHMKIHLHCAKEVADLGPVLRQWRFQDYDCLHCTSQHRNWWAMYSSWSIERWTIWLVERSHEVQILIFNKEWYMGTSTSTWRREYCWMWLGLERWRWVQRSFSSQTC